MTPTARAEVDAYEAEVRRSLRGRPDVDVEDVIHGIREHLDAELTGHAAPITAEDVAGALDRLGPPDAWAEGDAAPAPPDDDPRVAAIASIGFVLLGLSMVAGNLAAEVGWVVLIAGVLVARSAAERSGDRDRLVTRGASGIWWVGALVGVGAVLLGPAIFVWAAAQIGGVLEGWLADRVGAVGDDRPLPYWVGMLAVAGASTGVWWILLGALLRPLASPIRAALGPADPLLPARSSSWLMRAGAVLALLFIPVIILL